MDQQQPEPRWRLTEAGIREAGKTPHQRRMLRLGQRIQDVVWWVQDLRPRRR